MGKVMEWYRSFLRPTRKVTDMIPLAFLVTFLLLAVGELISGRMLRFMGLPSALSTEELTRVYQGEATTEGLVGAPAYLCFGSMYLSFIGMWVVFVLAMAIPPSNRRMLKKLILVHDRRSLKLAGIGALIGLGINTICVLLSVALGNIQMHFAQFELGPFLFLIFAVFVQSGAEELSCRLFLYQKLARRYRHPAVAIVLSAGFFAVLHGLNPNVSVVGIAQIVVTGLIMSLFVYYFDSLGACMAMHTAWNFTQSIFYGLPNSGVGSIYSVFRLDASSGGIFFDPGFGVEGSVGALLLLSAVFVGMIVYGRRHNLKPQDLWSEDERARELEQVSMGVDAD